MTRTSILACLSVLLASPAMAQANGSSPGALSLDPGSSGGSAGLISGGGTASFNLDGRDARPVPDSRAASPRAQSQAKAEADAKEERAKSRSRTARAQADDDGNSGKNSQVKKAKKQPRYDNADRYFYSYGFGTFGRRGLFRSRD
jgi:hypothetical protein